MYKTSVFFLILQVLLLSISTHVHSTDLSHANHEGMHIHFVDIEHDLNNMDKGHDGSSHYHFPFVLLLDNGIFANTKYLNRGYSEYKDMALSKTYAPPVPPPNSAS